jgi:hypothetical protein
MILLYTFVIVLLVTAKFIIDRRVTRLERKYAQTAKAADQLLHESAPPEVARAELLTVAGIAVSRRTHLKDAPSKLDLAESAKRHYQLGLLVQKRDRLEDKHDYWQHVSERFGRFVTRVREWKGKKLPYTMGVIDVSSLMYVIDRYGLGEYVSLQRLTELVSTHLTR